MKISDYKNVFSKIDTDTGMDSRIQNKLLYYEYEDYTGDRSMSKTYERERERGIRNIISKLVPAVPSVAFLALLLVVFLGIGDRLKKDGVVEPASENVSPIEQVEEIDGVSTDDVETTENVDVTENVEAAELVEEKPVNSDEVQIIMDDIAEEIGDIIGNNASVDVEAIAPTDAPDSVNDLIEEVKKKETKSDIKAEEEVGDFYFAHFDVINTRGYKSSIPGLMIRLHGYIDTINPEDLTDIILTRDGEPVKNGISKKYTVNQFEWGYEKVTDFYFKFYTENREPGVYGLTGKYKGEEFQVYNKVIEGKIEDLPADPQKLQGVHWAYYPDDEGNPQRLSEVVFNFSGTQHKFDPKDLTDIKFTRDGVEIKDYSFLPNVFRYLEVVGDSADTSFNLVFKEPFRKSGTYVISGKYQGVPFTSMEITIP